MNDNETTNFESVHAEPKPPKKEKPDAKKILQIAMIAVVIVALLLFCAIIITEIVYKVSGQPTYEGDVVGDIEYANGKIQFTDKTLPSSDAKIGNLLVLGASNQIGDAARASAKANVTKVYSYISNNSLVQSFKLQDSENIKLLPEVIEKFCKMMNDLDAATQCSNVLISYGYLDIAGATYKVLDCDYVQELGTSVYLKISNTETLELTTNPTVYNWLNDNCAKYGFINTGIDDNGEKVPARQFRYIGSAHASYIKENGLSYGSYINALKTDFTDPAKPMTIKAADGRSYAVYYVATSDGEETTFKVPSNYGYTVSGDNMGGFIVTVALSDKIDG